MLCNKKGEIIITSEDLYFSLKSKYVRTRCPICGATSHVVKKHWRECRKGHVFPDPAIRIIPEHLYSPDERKRRKAKETLKKYKYVDLISI